MGGSSNAPMPYQPAYQPQADQNYQALISNASPYASALPSQVIPQSNTAANNIINNPYYGQAQAGANTASSTAMNTVAPSQLAGSATASGLGTQGTNLAGTTSQGAGIAPGDLAAILSAIPSLTGGMGAANQILRTAFDPQNALYNQQSQKTMDTSNALNAMYGLSNSPFGAGVANQAQTNFNIDWQNNQLQRQIAGLGAYGSEQGQVASNLEGLNSNAVNAYNALTSTAAGNYATSTDAALNAFNTSSNLGTQGIQTQLLGSEAPANLYTQEQNQALQALGALAGNANSAINPSTALANAEGQYLTIGQNATSVADNATQINNQATASMFSGLASILGLGSGDNQVSLLGALGF